MERSRGAGSTLGVGLSVRAEAVTHGVVRLLLSCKIGKNAAEDFGLNLHVNYIN